MISENDVDPIQNKTQLMDLNTDVHLLILEELNLLDLVSLAETNVYFSFVAADVFRRKKSIKPFKIIDPLLDEFDNYVETNELIYMRKFSLILRVLKQFGHLISHLLIVYSSNELYLDVASTNIISKSINLHCSNTLTHFEIFSHHETFFDEMVKPFEKVEKLLIRGKYNKLGSNSLVFVELFPIIHQLNLEYIEVNDTSCIDQEFSHLEKLHIDISRNDNPSRFTENEVFNILKRNPQIRSLELDKSSRKFLMKVNQILPRLESLRLLHYFPFSESVERIVFENVKNFSIAESAESAPKNIEFPKLMEYHTENLKPGLYNKWMELVENSTYLKKLYVEKVNDARLLNLTTIGLNLSEVYFNLKSDVNDQTIVRFIKNNEQLKTIHFTRDTYKINVFKTVAETLRQQYGDKWTIEEELFSMFLKRI